MRDGQPSGAAHSLPSPSVAKDPLDAPPTPDELVELAKDVEYEFGMFSWAGSQLISLPTPSTDEEHDFRNACVEVFLLHLRNIIDFFASTPSRDDVVAHHYAPGWSADMGGDELRWLLKMSRSINKRLAHLTAYRRRVPQPVDAEHVLEVGVHVLLVQRRFYAALPAPMRPLFRDPGPIRE